MSEPIWDYDGDVEFVVEVRTNIEDGPQPWSPKGNMSPMTANLNKGQRCRCIGVGINAEFKDQTQQLYRKLVE